MNSPGTRWPSLILAPLLVCLVAYYFQNSLFQLVGTQRSPAELPIDHSIPKFESKNQSTTCIALAQVLPESVYSEQHPQFNKSVNGYWSLPAAEHKPSCIVRPKDVYEVSVAVKTLKAAYDQATGPSIRFAVRSGGHSPEAGFASIDGGVLIETSLLNEVTLSKDKKSVVVGVGARWHDVSSKLDDLGLAIVGGRNSHVGVGGLVLGGTPCPYIATLPHKHSQLSFLFRTS